MSNESGYRTVSAPASAQLEEKRSRFIAQIMPVKTESEAVDFINKVKSENRKARHNVYAYLLRERNISRYSDDGEPQGTGGVPVLETLKGAELVDVCVVVTRYFGGVLLGTGGLVRAYSGACRLAVEAADVMIMKRCSKFTVRCGYNLYGKIQSLAEEFGAKIVYEDFSDAVKLCIIVESGSSRKFEEKITNAANGRLELEEIVDLYENFA